MVGTTKITFGSSGILAPRRGRRTGRFTLLDNGAIVDDDEIPEELRDEIKKRIVKSRDVSEPEIEWFKIAGDKIVDRRDWPGKYIPIVPFIGEETVIEGVMDRKGHARSEIDAQRICTTIGPPRLVERGRRCRPRRPYIARADAIEGRTEQWATANVKNYSVLVYNGVDEAGRPILPPARVEPPTMAQAYIQGMTIARQDLMSVTGQYQADLGMPSMTVIRASPSSSGKLAGRYGDVSLHRQPGQSRSIRLGRILIGPDTEKSMTCGAW